jgi:AGZA family xanthine/uracil permease-like MFS transporter
VQWPDFSTFGRIDLGVISRLGVLATMLVTFSIMLSDFFDTSAPSSAWAPRGGFLDRQRPAALRQPGAAGRTPSAPRWAGVANSSSNTTYIESAAGVTEGGPHRPGPR